MSLICTCIVGSHGRHLFNSIAEFSIENNPAQRTWMLNSPSDTTNLIWIIMKTLFDLDSHGFFTLCSSLTWGVYFCQNVPPCQIFSSSFSSQSPSHLFTMVTMAGLRHPWPPIKQNPASQFPIMIAPSYLDFPTYTDPYGHKTHDTWHKTLQAISVPDYYSCFYFLHPLKTRQVCCNCHCHNHHQNHHHVQKDWTNLFRKSITLSRFALVWDTIWIRSFRQSRIAREWEIRRSLFKWNCGRKFERETRRKFIAD